LQDKRLVAFNIDLDAGRSGHFPRSNKLIESYSFHSERPTTSEVARRISRALVEGGYPHTIGNRCLNKLHVGDMVDS
jgi:hypothetical protein